MILLLAVGIWSCGSSSKATDSNASTDTSVEKTTTDNAATDRAEAQREQLMEMMEELDLTEEQQIEFVAITRKYREEMRVKIQDNRGDRTAMRQAFMEVQQKQNEELQEILSEEQFSKYQDLARELMRERMSGRRGNN